MEDKEGWRKEEGVWRKHGGNRVVLMKSYVKGRMRKKRSAKLQIREHKK